MGTAPAYGEITVLAESCRAFAVDSDEMRTGSDKLRRSADRFARALGNLIAIDAHLASAGLVPGGMFSVISARTSLAVGIGHVRRIADQLEVLSSALALAAAQYEERETLAQSLFGEQNSVRAAWRELYGSGWDALLWASPIRLASAPMGRFYAAAAQRVRRSLHPAQRWATGSPYFFAQMIGSEALVRYNEIAWLGPTGWVSFARDAATAAWLTPKALEPVRDLSAPGLGREEAAQFARSLSGVVAPGGDVGDAAAVASAVVADTHALLGHRHIAMTSLPKRPGDVEPDRRPVRSFEDSLAVMAELDPEQGATYGELRIDRTTSAEGEHSWQVFIPGGQGFNPTNVHSLIHSVRAVEGQMTPSVAMVASALREVGAVKGEPIVITGHSHGGITGSMFANNPRMRAEFDVALVITAGSPIDRHTIRADTHVLAFEHTEDPIPGADGVNRLSKPGLTRVERTLADSADPLISGGQGIHHIHDYPNYVDSARIADGHPDLAHVRGILEGVIPEGEVETFRFRAEITR